MITLFNQYAQMATLTDVTSVNYSGDQRVDALLFDSVDWNYLLPTRNTLYYTFDLSVVGLATPAWLTPFNASQRPAAIQILAYAAGVTGVRFAEVPSGASADIHFASYNLEGAHTSGLTRTSEQYTYAAGTVLTSYEGEAFVFLDNAEFAYTNTSLNAGSAGFEVLLHEIGHALGLGHPFDGLHTLPASLDNTNNTVMSYTPAGANKTGFQSYDLMALQWIYGGDGLRGSVGFNSSKGPTLSQTLPSAPAVLTDQTFTGTAANESFSGGTNNDVIGGGGGVDTAVYSGRFADYALVFRRASGTATVTDQRPGADGTDQLTSIERLQFADKVFELTNPPRTGSPTFGESPSFLFDAVCYLLNNPELVPTVSLSTAYDHFRWVGAAESALPNVWFDPVYYANRWSDLKTLQLDALTLFTHYNLYGVWEGRSAGPVFDRYDGTRYLRDNPDVAAYVDANVKDFLGSRSNGALAHYVIYGADEGRTAYDQSGSAIDLAILIGIQPG